MPSIWRYTLRYKNIVYTPTLKCASKYTRNLLLSLGFEFININDVLEKDKMFTTIMDPHVRRTKGITQTLIDFKSTKKLLHGDFVEFIKNATVLDELTVPYTLQFKKYMNRMIFLPIDMEQITLTDLLKKFFEIHCPELNKKEFPDFLDKNIATTTKKKLYKFIKKNASNNELIDLVFLDDLHLWNDCKKKIESDLDGYLTSKYQ